MIKRRKAPYGNTAKDTETSVADINRLLKEYGINNFQWTQAYDIGKVVVKFALEVKPEDFRPVQIEVPKFIAKRRTWNTKKNCYEVLELPNWSQGLRLTYWYLKAKLESISYGLRDAEFEFLGDILVKLPNGKETTMGKAMQGKLPSGTGTEAIPIPLSPAEEVDESG